MLKNYRIGFEWRGLILFLTIMLPNFIWFAVPAPDDVLRSESATGLIDTAGSVFQVLMAASLCLTVRKQDAGRKITRPVIAAAACVLLYVLCWVLYYQGKTGAAVLMGLTVFPCAAFLFYSFAGKNFIAAGFAGMFSVCHLIHTIVNFLV